mmetsp:Transcript_5068/g.12711  ORF Transcript_5068/g.12711 Transcript_5068/m.12711 type:complete len:415 (+) Transcript_5068:1462-2706(+)
MAMHAGIQRRGVLPYGMLGHAGRRLLWRIHEIRGRVLFVVGGRVRLAELRVCRLGLGLGFGEGAFGFDNVGVDLAHHEGSPAAVAVAVGWEDGGLRRRPGGGQVRYLDVAVILSTGVLRGRRHVDLLRLAGRRRRYVDLQEMDAVVLAVRTSAPDGPLALLGGCRAIVTVDVGMVVGLPRLALALPPIPALPPIAVQDGRAHDNHQEHGAQCGDRGDRPDVHGGVPPVAVPGGGVVRIVDISAVLRVVPPVAAVAVLAHLLGAYEQQSPQSGMIHLLQRLQERLAHARDGERREGDPLQFSAGGSPRAAAVGGEAHDSPQEGGADADATVFGNVFVVVVIVGHHREQHLGGRFGELIGVDCREVRFGDGLDGGFDSLEAAPRRQMQFSSLRSLSRLLSVHWPRPFFTQLFALAQ